MVSVHFVFTLSTLLCIYIYHLFWHKTMACIIIYLFRVLMHCVKDKDHTLVLLIYPLFTYKIQHKHMLNQSFTIILPPFISLTRDQSYIYTISIILLFIYSTTIYLNICLQHVQSHIWKFWWWFNNIVLWELIFAAFSFFFLQLGLI